MLPFLVQLAELCNTILDRIRTAIGFDLTQAQWIRMLLAIIIYTQIVRPFMVKHAEKEGEKQLANMEKRDQDNKEKGQREQAINDLRTGKKPPKEEEATIASQIVNGADKVRQRAVKGAEEGLVTAEEIRAKRLENWEEDEEFLQNFSKTSDRSYAK